MFKGASRRSGGSSPYGWDMARWGFNHKARVKLHYFARRLMEKALEKGGADPFVSGLNDYWLAELVRRLLAHDLIQSELLNRTWSSVQPRFRAQGRSVELTEIERQNARVTITRKLQSWMDTASS